MIENLAGQVQTIEVMDVIGSRGKLMGVDETVAKAQQAALPVTLSDEAKALLAAKQAEIEKRTQDALIRAAEKMEEPEVKRWGIPDDPEDAIWRAKYGDDDEDDK